MPAAQPSEATAGHWIFGRDGNGVNGGNITLWNGTNTIQVTDAANSGFTLTLPPDHGHRGDGANCYPYQWKRGCL